MKSEDRVLVGIDGSDSASKALEWALDYAQMAGLPVRAVSAWAFPVYYGELQIPEEWDIEASTRSAATQQMEDALEHHPDVTAEVVVEFGHPSQVLIEASKGARLLVVGNRGHSGASGILLGSVSTHCVHAAHCPVVVVR